MATAIGTNVVTSIARHFILPEITDNIYNSNPLWFRMNAAKKKMIQGGTQIEFPLMYQRFAAGGFYSGLDLLDVAPSDTVKNGALDWKQAFVPVTVDGLTLIKTDSPEAIANFINMYFAQAEMELAEIVGNSLWTDGVSNTKNIDGLKGVVDDGTVLASYAGITRSTNTWWQSTVDSSTTTLALDKMQTMHGNCAKGGRAPTLIVVTQLNYNRYWVLMSNKQNIYLQAQGHDEQLANAGFTNMLFNGCPIVVDSHVPANHLFFLNEDFMYYGVSPRADFYMEDFQKPIQQDAMVAKILWAGNLICTNVGRQGKMTAVTA